MDKQQQVVAKLKHLFQVCKDSEKGFRQAASEMHDEKYRTMFISKAQERNRFAARIREELRKLGGIGEHDGSLTGTLHRGWMNARYQMNLHNDVVVARECLHGEEVALNAYQDFLDNKISPEVAPVLEEQFVKIIETRDELLDLAHVAEEPKDTILL